MTKYVLLYGVIWWGSFVTLSMSVLYYATHSPVNWSRFSLLVVPIYYLAGLLWGIMTWLYTERAYRRFQHINQEPEQAAAPNGP